MTQRSHVIPDIAIGDDLLRTAVHLDATMRWLCRAQDACEGGGVAGSYSVGARSQWRPAYPETTGYIIPTFFDYAKVSECSDYAERSRRMASWECDVQMASGAVQAGLIGPLPQRPAVFNTGQVLFGWARAYRETSDARYLDAAIRAADFLVAAQDNDGAWRAHASPLVRPGINLYDARTAWGLAELGKLTGRPQYTEAAVRNLDFVCALQHDNGWFPNCCTRNDSTPVLHLLAYAMEGLLEAGALLAVPTYLAAARRAADALIPKLRDDGSLAGQFDDKWDAAAEWSCLTGDAQTAIVWLRLHQVTGDARYLEAAARLNRFVMATQIVAADDPGVRGGVAGSHPISGAYMGNTYPNWAAKFLADALMLEMRIVSR